MFEQEERTCFRVCSGRSALSLLFNLLNLFECCQSFFGGGGLELEIALQNNHVNKV